MKQSTSVTLHTLHLTCGGTRVVSRTCVASGNLILAHVNSSPIVAKMYLWLLYHGAGEGGGVDCDGCGGVWGVQIYTAAGCSGNGSSAWNKCIYTAYRLGQGGGDPNRKLPC